MGAGAVIMAAGCGVNQGQPSVGSSEQAQHGSDGLSGTSGGSGSGDGGGDGLAPLSSVPVPRPVGGDIIDQAAAIRLGKALFWDAQAGGDGMTACATCHYAGGADVRVTNAINPGPDGTFQAVSGAGQFFSLVNLISDDRVGSQGVVGAIFSSVDPNPAHAADICTPDQGAPFFANRRVTGRNAPSAIGAAYYRQAFWDGRANDTFNGKNPFGNTGNGSGTIAVHNAALASQAVGPPGSSTEMSCAGRNFDGANSLGAKILARAPLAHQVVSPTDSVLGALSAAPGYGLTCGNTTCSYRALIQAAFGSALAADAVNQFARIWGQAIQAYESTLIPNRTPLDLYLAGNRAALTASQQQGLNIFTGKGSCTKCHAGAELSDATVSFAATHGLINEDGGDQGFHNDGVRPTAEDLGRAALGPNNVPWSQSGATADRGAFKTPVLRNVKLNAPYFHNGGAATLADVVAFYNRGGDFRNPELAKRMQPLSLSATDQSALVDFLANGLTDCRTEKQQAPFDHPSLPLPNGPSGDLPAVGAAGTGTCP